MSLPVKDAVSHGNFTALTGTFAHTVTNSQSNLILIVAVNNNSGTDTITGVTYAGVAMTKLASISGSSNTTDFFYLINPATGTNNIVVSQSGGTNTAIMCAVSYYNTAQSSTFGTPATAQGSGSSSSNTVTTTSTNQLVIESFVGDSVTSATPPAGETVEVSDTPVWYNAIGDIPATGSNMTLSWSISGLGWQQISVAMNGFSGGGGPKRFVTSMDPLMIPGYLPGVTQ